MMIAPTQFFTVESFGSLAGAAGLTYVITNGLRQAFQWNPAWLGLLVAQCVVLLAAATVDGGGISKYALAIANGFLVFSTATGAAAVSGAAATKRKGRGFGPGTASGPGFFDRWL